MSPQTRNVKARRRKKAHVASSGPPLLGIIGRKLEEQEDDREWRGVPEPRITAKEFMLDMGFPEPWIDEFLVRIRPYDPWMRERYVNLRLNLAGRTGRLLQMIRDMSREDERDERATARELYRVTSEKEQRVHITEWWQDEHRIADKDVIDVMRPLYPGKSDAFLQERMKEWGLKHRLGVHYEQRRKVRDA